MTVKHRMVSLPVDSTHKLNRAATRRGFIFGLSPSPSKQTSQAHERVCLLLSTGISTEPPLAQSECSLDSGPTQLEPQSPAASSPIVPVHMCLSGFYRVLLSSGAVILPGKENTNQCGLLRLKLELSYKRYNQRSQTLLELRAGRRQK